MSLTFANPAAAAAANLSAQPNFQLASVGVVNDTYRFLTAPSAPVIAAADGVNIIAPAAPALSVLVRAYARNLAAEYEAAWFLDPAGSDANAGTTVGAPLKTCRELFTRVRAIHQDVTVTFAAGDFTATAFDVGQFDTNGFTMLAVGNVTSSAVDAFAAVVGQTPGAAGTNAGAVRSLTTATALSFVAKQRLRATDGGQSGKTAYVQLVTIAGVGGAANVDRFGSMTNPRTTTLVNNGTPAGGDHYVIDTLNTTIGQCLGTVKGHGRVVVQDCNISNASLGDAHRVSGDNGNGNGFLWYQCDFLDAVIVFQCPWASLNCCQLRGAVTFLTGYYVPRKPTFWGLVTLQAGAVVTPFNGGTFAQGGSLLLQFNAWWDHGTSTLGDWNWCDGNTAHAVELDGSAVLTNHGSTNQMWGLTNVYTAVTILIQGRASWTNSSKPSIPGTGVAGRDATIGGTAKLYAAMPYEETTTTANNGAAIVAV